MGNNKKKGQLSHSIAVSESPFLQKLYFQMTNKDFIWTDLWSKTETVACALQLWSTEAHGEGELLILLLLCALLAPLPSSVFWSYPQLPKATSQVQAHLLLNLCFGHWGIHCYCPAPHMSYTHPHPYYNGTALFYKEVNNLPNETMTGKILPSCIY